MTPGAEHAAQRLERLLGAETGGVVGKQLGQSDDGIERGPQLVAHIGEEARFSAARLHRLVASNLEMLHQIGQLRFALFERRDVAPSGDGPTFSSTVLADPEPSAV